MSDATRQQVIVSACLLAGDTVCECVSVCAGVSVSVHVTVKKAFICRDGKC